MWRINRTTGGVASSVVRFSRRKKTTFAGEIDQLLENARLGNLQQQGALGSPKLSMLLLHPPGACSAFTRSGSQYPPLGLTQLKALIGDTARVDVLEADGFGLTTDETIGEIWKAAPLAVGMTVTCGTKKLTNAWSTVVKNLAPEQYRPLTIVGGPAAAFETQSILDECPNVDVVVKGEGEVTFPTIVDVIENRWPIDTTLEKLSAIPGVCVRQKPHMNDRKIPTLPKEAFQSLPFPDLSASPVEKYKAPDAQRYPMVTMMTQRYVTCTTAHK